MCKECQGNSYMYGIGGLFGADKQFNLDLELVAGVVVGGAVAKQSNSWLDGVQFFQQNQMYKDLTQVAVGVLATQFDMPLVVGAGYGMIGVGGASLIDGLLGGGNNNSPAGVSGDPRMRAPGTDPTTIEGVRENAPGTTPDRINNYERSEKMKISVN